MLVFFPRQSLEKKRYTALKKWTDALESVHLAVVSKTGIAGRVPPDAAMPPETFVGRDLEGRWN